MSVKFKTIELQSGSGTITLTLEEAQELYDQLHSIFGQKTVVKEYSGKSLPFTWPQYMVPPSSPTFNPAIPRKYDGTPEVWCGPQDERG